MNITMNDDQIVSVAQLREFVQFTKSANFSSKEKKEAYQWIGRTLERFRYKIETKKNKSVIKQYIMGMTSYSEGMVDKLIRMKKDHRRLFLRKRTQPQFPVVYTGKDIELLADVTNAYRGQNGQALKKVCRDMCDIYGDAKFERLKYISVSHLYNLKRREVFKTKSLTYTKTNPTTVPIGERRKPEPNGIPGYIRIDSVHQGDLEKEKGVYYINLVDEVTQFEVVAAVEKISEQYLVPALLEALNQLPFVIINFHSDNGSEYINHTVAELLEKIRVTQTKSRSRHSNDNALAEGKNGAVVRTVMGYAHIPQKYAERINRFCMTYLNPFLNFHRPSAFAVDIVDAKGKIQKTYPQSNYQTPWQKLKLIPNFESFLKPGVTSASLEKQATSQTHLASATAVETARAELFKDISRRP